MHGWRYVNMEEPSDCEQVYESRLVPQISQDAGFEGLEIILFFAVTSLDGWACKPLIWS